MEGNRLIRSLVIDKLLSYGREGELIPLEPLNVLIGPNGSGKSNLIEAISLLAATPTDLARRISDGGGFAEWLWRGEGRSRRSSVSATVEVPGLEQPLDYVLSLKLDDPKFRVAEERITRQGAKGADAVALFERTADEAYVPVAADLDRHHMANYGLKILGNRVPVENLSPTQSVLSQPREPFAYREIGALAERFRAIRFYRKLALGPDFSPRRLQDSDAQSDYLEEDASNLNVVLQSLKKRPEVWSEILKNLRLFYNQAQDLDTPLFQGFPYIGLSLREESLSGASPGARLSDGTLRYLCLLAILCHPEPPSLICLEEPELGLHPDLIQSVADLLIDASQRTQLIVTTHSSRLVTALGDLPEAVLVCEQRRDGTHLNRLKREEVQVWLQDYSLGQLWTMGEIGGNRW